MICGKVSNVVNTGIVREDPAGHVVLLDVRKRICISFVCLGTSTSPDMSQPTAKIGEVAGLHDLSNV